MNKKLLPLLIALAIATSGCLSITGEDPDPIDSDDGDDPHDHGNGDHGNGDHGSEDDGKDGNETVNHPPTASLTANLTEGPANLTVTFELDGSDPDDDPLTWTLDLGDGNTTNGSELPTTYEHTYTTPGNFTVTLEVSDGTDSINATQNITVLALTDPVVFEGSALIPDPWAVEIGGCLLEVVRSDLSEIPIPEGITGTEHELEPSLWGWSYSFDIEGVIAEFWSTEPAILGSGSEGEVPEGATHLYVCINDLSVIDVDYTLTLTP